MSTPLLLQSQEVSVAINGRVLLRGIDFSLQGGSVVGFMGGNGTGKSTLFNVLNGFVPPSSGKVLYYGTVPSRHRPLFISRSGQGVSRSFQVPHVIDDLTVRENLGLGIRLQGEGFWSLLDRSRTDRDTEHSYERSIRQMAELFGLESKLDKQASVLSYGERRLVAVITVMLSGCQIILLDEPFANLNTLAIKRLKEALRASVESQGRLVLMIEHPPDNLIGFVDRLFLVHNKRCEELNLSGHDDQSLRRLAYASSVQLE